VAFLGHVISGEGIVVDLTQIEAVMNWPRSMTITEIQSFLALAGYYRCFMEKFLCDSHAIDEVVKER